MDTPITIIIFGATGNLYAHKLSSALFLLFEQNLLPVKFTIIGFARKPFTNETFRELTKQSIRAKRAESEIDEAVLEDFMNHVAYFQGDPSNVSDFLTFHNFLSEKDVSYGKAANRLIHIATPPYLYEGIFKHIAQAEIISHGERWTRVMIEKPFGTDSAEARKLTATLAQIFTENQVFHIDHYVAKETVRGIFDWRFVNDGPEPMLDSAHIEKIKIAFNESNVVGSRGAFYDGVGAFRDVGQNHMLELLALIAMERPAAMDDVSVRAARATVLNAVSLVENGKVVRGQYDGYHSEEGVPRDSQTETFFRVDLHIDNPRWKGTVFELEGGKGLVDMHSDITTTTVFIEIHFKDGRIMTLPIQPVLGTAYDSYTTVYLDAISGNQTVFISNQEIIAEWKITDEVVKKLQSVPVVLYKKGSTPEEIG